MGDALFVPGEKLGPYRLERVLGEGGMGVVYAATAADGARVAVKLLRAEEDEARRRFVREATLARRIESRHVVPILELGEVRGLTYLVMPFYPGGSLSVRVRALGRLSVSETTELAAEIGRGLDALHDAGILHRDVKPSNVLLDAEMTAALSDFGLARAGDSTRLTRDGQLVGTPHYLAPELIEGREATHASDLYGLGCVLYECLVGAPPFEGRAPAEIGFAHLVEPPPDPRERRADLPADVAAAVLTALAKEPSARPTSATALARMLHLAHTSAPA